MTTSVHPPLAASAAALLAALLWAAPASAAPDFDEQGYVNSTARCSDTAVVFGATERSRVAICDDGDGGYQYRGVRIEDGAKLITGASSSGSGTFSATRAGITYTVSAKSLTITEGETTIRTEPMVDFHGASAPDTEDPDPSPTEAPAETPADTPTPTTPLPPPLPAEEGHIAS
ncbi:hypothetical protein H7J77_07530 [Mycolicibacillus parakoreensis]|uniref:Serine/threonine protein kinase n=1 Tax=Mycolicibacillus parakoreensis TaxID=1069221 RepID=A0ABY3TZ43_9MYCO|nr:hypothetical protein [Mycolicibacillus parakoreensis]MCV7315387.1 hypothetical protein [Mycolicibacillus parakoreensis]ULN52144.1 hypothetical protein MIU77_14970 [Mycolicibacillus parakoreensis]